MIERLAWIGLGRQGAPMARRLLAANYPLSVWDRDPSSVAQLVAVGARAAGSAADAAADAAGIFLCLPDEEAVNATLFATNGVVAAARDHAIIIDHGSMLPAAACQLARGVADARGGLRFIDAPVSGGPSAAADGTMIAWIGGGAMEVAAARRWLSAFVRNVHHMGPVGSGQTAKACHQLVACGSIVLWREALQLGAACGLDPAALAASMAGAAADSKVRETFASGLAADVFPSRSLANLTKDLDTIERLAAHIATALPMARVAYDQFSTRIAALVAPDTHISRLTETRS